MIHKAFCVVKMFLGNPIETLCHLVIMVYPIETMIMAGSYGLLLIRHNAILRYASKIDDYNFQLPLPCWFLLNILIER